MDKRQNQQIDVVDATRPHAERKVIRRNGSTSWGVVFYVGVAQFCLEQLFGWENCCLSYNGPPCELTIENDKQSLNIRFSWPQFGDREGIFNITPWSTV